MTGPDPAEHAWWLASRAAGIVALLCITLSVAVGLAMAGRVSRDRRLARMLIGVHQQTALVGLVAIAVHGIALLGDRFLAPGLAGIAVPFVIDHEPLWTGLGVIGGWLAAMLGLSYWIRDRIGAALWRRLHRATILVYVLSVAHTLGAGTDASEPWMRVLLLTTGAPILFLFLMRVLPPPRTGPAFRRFRVADVTPESAAVTSFALEPLDGKPLAPFAPGQFVTVRADVPGAGRQLRSYSLSAAPDPRRHRISVKRDGVFSRHLHAAVAAGDVLELGGPSGTFVLDRASRRPVVLLSAGVGATPVLAMLHALVADGSQPRGLVAARRAQRRRARVPRGGARAGRAPAHRPAARALQPARAARPARARLPRRGPDRRGRAARARHPRRGGALPLRPGRVPRRADRRAARGGSAGRSASAASASAPPRRAGPPTAASPAAVAFSRSGVNATWDQSCATLLDLAEAHGVPAPAGCRVGSCHSCRTDVLDGSVSHDPEPLEPPPAGQRAALLRATGGRRRARAVTPPVQESR